MSRSTPLARRLVSLCALGLPLALAAACAAPRAEQPSAASKSESLPDNVYAAPPAPPPPSPQAGAQGQPGYPASPGASPVAPQAGVPGLPLPNASATPAKPGRSARVQAFYQSTVSLELAGADCQTACRALEAMDRTAGELCEIDGKDGICKDAEGRVRDARDRVRNACGSCRDGTILDRNAPVPSRK